MKIGRKRKRLLTIGMLLTLAMVFQAGSAVAGETFQKKPETVSGSYYKDLITGEEGFDDGMEFAPKARSSTNMLETPEYNPETGGISEPPIYGSYYKDLITGEEGFDDGMEFAPKARSSTGVLETPEYNPETGGISVPPQPGIAPRVVIGDDDRKIVERPQDHGEHRNTVYIEAYFGNEVGYGTGFMVGPSAVATAGHCIYDQAHGGWADRVTVTPARAGSSAPYSSASYTKLEAGGNWVHGSDPQDDWGVITINKRLGDQVGWLGLRWQSEAYTGETVTLAGYPGFCKGVSYLTNPFMFKHSAPVSYDSQWRIINYETLDTSQGQSGAPVFRYYAYTGFTAIAIHSRDNMRLNQGVLIHEWLFNKLTSYR